MKHGLGLRPVQQLVALKAKPVAGGHFHTAQEELVHIAARVTEWALRKSYFHWNILPWTGMEVVQDTAWKGWRGKNSTVGDSRVKITGSKQVTENTKINLYFKTRKHEKNPSVCA